MTQENSEQQHQFCKIFIVDDDEQQANLMRAMAETAQLETELFTNSVDFLNTAISVNDIVVLDLQMPDKDGIEIMRELASQNIKPNFILVSGFDERVLHSAKQLAESKHLNVVATLSKPLKAKEFILLLSNTYAECLAKHKQQIVNPLPAKNTEQITIDELKLAIRKHQLIIHFQPIVCFNNKQLQSTEILMRWQHPTKGLILPEQFLPLAEEHRLMNLLTEEILRLTIVEYHKLTASGINIKVSINLSAQNITDLSMPEKLEELVKNNQIVPDSIILEVTESALMNEISESLDILNRLRMKGFSLSIDDFGTGYSSLVKLYQAPFSELKIDQYFVMHMATDPDAAAIVRICILLAKELKMHTVAEGVETEAIWNQLKKLGCDRAQGSFITNPMLTEEFTLWVKNWEIKHA
jgi:EAL domain-containing protein (putative c-di-GMP-specific phosphodiesterase class I)/AmiR/NasT family two-component response regulator